jgi:hypothetical protein
LNRQFSATRVWRKTKNVNPLPYKMNQVQTVEEGLVFADDI